MEHLSVILQNHEEICMVGVSDSAFAHTFEGDGFSISPVIGWSVNAMDIIKLI